MLQNVVSVDGAFTSLSASNLDTMGSRARSSSDLPVECSSGLSGKHHGVLNSFY